MVKHAVIAARGEPVLSFNTPRFCSTPDSGLSNPIFKQDALTSSPIRIYTDIAQTYRAGLYTAVPRSPPPELATFRAPHLQVPGCGNCQSCKAESIYRPRGSRVPPLSSNTCNVYLPEKSLDRCRQDTDGVRAAVDSARRRGGGTMAASRSTVSLQGSVILDGGSSDLQQPSLDEPEDGRS
ncbi:hypothetical protein [Rubidibacter lacunae]|uniref:hypothetical protein n=1 Tax=Rubidibacter lacunae TaxID=582514 RepID=UPI0012EB158A|nr:hypothetical protein [Rubidibacter lacunae]